MINCLLIVVSLAPSCQRLKHVKWKFCLLRINNFYGGGADNYDGSKSMKSFYGSYSSEWIVKMVLFPLYILNYCKLMNGSTSLLSADPTVNKGRKTNWKYGSYTSMIFPRKTESRRYPFWCERKSETSFYWSFMCLTFFNKQFFGKK